MSSRKVYVVIVSSHEDAPCIQIAYTHEEAETIAMALIGECLLSELTGGDECVLEDDDRTIGETFSNLHIVRNDVNGFVYAKCGDSIIEIQETIMDVDRLTNRNFS